MLELASGGEQRVQDLRPYLVECGDALGRDGQGGHGGQDAAQFFRGRRERGEVLAEKRRVSVEGTPGGDLVEVFPPLTVSMKWRRAYSAGHRVRS